MQQKGIKTDTLPKPFAKMVLVNFVKEYQAKGVNIESWLPEQVDEFFQDKTGPIVRRHFPPEVRTRLGISDGLSLLMYFTSIQEDVHKLEEEIRNVNEKLQKLAPMEFSFNPHRHVKIWLTRAPSSFLNMENRLRLIRMRETNPKDEIHFIFDSALMHPTTLEKLYVFCQNHNLIPGDIRSIARPKDPVEEQILAIYYSLFNQFYSEKADPSLRHAAILTFMSDILRILSFIYERGTYSDFDVAVDTNKLPANVIVDTPLLFGFEQLDGGILPNNDIVAVVNEAHAFSDIKRIQNEIIKYCQPMKKDSAFNSHFLFCGYSLDFEFRRRLKCLHITNQDKTISELFSTVLEVTKTLEQFKAGYQKIGISVIDYQATVDSGWSLEEARHTTRINFLNSILILVSGAQAITRALNLTGTPLDEFMKYSFSQYGLGNAFSGQAFNFTKSKNLSEKISDFSYHEEDWKKIMQKEDRFSRSVDILKDRWLKKHPRIVGSAAVEINASAAAAATTTHQTSSNKLPTP